MAHVTNAASIADEGAHRHTRFERRAPVAGDGAAVWDLIAACPPLDQNSLYANVLQCTDFADTCAIAVDGDEAVGWVSGYVPPNEPDTYFLWQVAVRPSARGAGLPRRLIADILNREPGRTARYIKTTITPDNDASWALFRRIADWLGAPLETEEGFDAEACFKGRHESETLVRIGPFKTPPAAV